MPKKVKTHQAPPTVLVITLNTDGTGTLLARRGELAHLSQFTYSAMREIVSAIQMSAAQLLEIEKSPPPLESNTTASAETDDSGSEEATESPREEGETAAISEPANEDEIGAAEIDNPAIAADISSDSDVADVDRVGLATNPNDAQPKLF